MQGNNDIPLAQEFFGLLQANNSEFGRANPPKVRPYLVGRKRISILNTEGPRNDAQYATFWPEEIAGRRALREFVTQTPLAVG